MDESTAGALLQEGSHLLQAGRWNEARPLLEAVAAENPSAEALEALGLAMWWQNDAENLFPTRERAYQLYRSRGEREGAARVAIWLNSDYLDFRGEVAIANGWRQRARQLLLDLPTNEEHGWLAIFEGDAALLIDEDTRTARRYAQEAIGIGRMIEMPDLEAIGLALEGIALVSEGEVADGMSRLDGAAAAALAGELRELFSTTFIICYLIYACERVQDYDRAGQWCQRMREYTDRIGFDLGQGVCRAHYAGVLVLRGEWEEAERELADAMIYLERSRPPAVAEARVRLAELRRRQGRLDEADALFREAEWHLLASLGLAELSLRRGDVDGAIEYLQRVLRNLPESSIAQRATALEVLGRAYAAAGNGRAAAESQNELEAISRKVGTPALKASSLRLQGVVAAATDDLELARQRLEDATAAFERQGSPYDAAVSALEQAGVLRRLGRPERANLVARAALQTFERLGAAAEASRAKAFLAEEMSADGPRSSSTILTARQVEVLRLVARGLSDRQIAQELVMSEHTVHRHVSNILQRLELPSRAAAVAHASRLGLL